MKTYQPYLSVIIPAHNEERRLDNCLDRTIRYLWSGHYQYEIIVVENGSTDATWEICRKYLRTFNYVRAIKLDQRGKGIAVRTGMLAARGRYRMFMDADLSTSLHEIENALALMPENDVVIGSRALKRSQVVTTLKRRVIGRAFHEFVTALVPEICDTQCGFKVFRDWCAMDLFERSQINGMAFDVELLWLAQQRHYRIYEMPVRWKHDPDSRVRLAGDSLQMLWDVINIPAIHSQEQKIPA